MHHSFVFWLVENTYLPPILTMMAYVWSEMCLFWFSTHFKSCDRQSWVVSSISQLSAKCRQGIRDLKSSQPTIDQVLTDIAVEATYRKDDPKLHKTESIYTWDNWDITTTLHINLFVWIFYPWKFLWYYQGPSHKGYKYINTLKDKERKLKPGTEQQVQEISQLWKAKVDLTKLRRENELNKDLM